MKKALFVLFAFFVVGFIVLAMLYQSGMIGTGVRTPPGEKSPAPQHFQWKKLQEITVPTFYTAVGTIRSREEITVVSRLLTARVTEVRFRSGEHFRKGDVLIRLEDRDLKAKVDAAAENLKGAKSRLSFAQAEYARNAKLIENRAVAARSYEQAVSNLNAAKAEVAMMKNQLIDAQTSFDYATIRAPFNGIVLKRDCEPGDLATPLNPLMKLFNPSKLELRVPVRENLVRKIRIGNVLQVRVESVGKSYRATVREIVPSVDTGSRTFLVNAMLDGDTTGLIPGMYAVCDIPTGTKKVLAVEQSALLRIGQLEYLNIKGKNGEAIRQLVKTVPLRKNWAEIVSGAGAGTEFRPETR